MKYRIIVFLCLICFVFIGFIGHAQHAMAAGNNYYVATTGSDSNAGTLSSPWLTIQHSASIVVAGDTVNIEAGTYTEKVTPANSGTAGSLITYQNYNDGTVIINGTGVVTGDTGLFDISSKSYIVISGLTIQNCTDGAGVYVAGSSYIYTTNLTITATYESGILVMPSGSNNIYINGCIVSHTNSSTYDEAISLLTVNQFEIENCTVYDTQNDKEGIDCKVGCTNGSVHNNTVHNTRIGIYVEAAGTATSNIVIYDNLIYGCSTVGGIVIADEHGMSTLTNISIYNNILYNNRVGFQVALYGTETYNFSFINNTLYDNGTITEIDVNPPASQLINCVIRNNIIDNSAAGIYPLEAPAYGSPNLIIDHNLFYNSFGWNVGSVYGTSYQLGNPNLLNPTTAFDLTASSKLAINTGSPTYAPTTDYIGNARANPPCIGAYEYQSGPSITANYLPNGTVGVAYFHSMEVTDGTPPYTWTIVSGELPTGLLFSANGDISGVPMIVGGPNSVTFTVTDSKNDSTSQTLSITINSVPTLASIIQQFGNTGTPGWIAQDVNNDGVINVLDMINVVQNPPGQ